ncbi:hypothetical protein Tdes44962_MAKER09559 [Teratosphaeria destructans]|uniref:Uncharacterized protein n=1 Tax=Teratosphaeria destructans TaxID=418781 RepID=A0A9W7SSZ8_9PEZI|nr:hypothetical protein Tdes44962_MAKER09559 [Teratosphaeria destructans]
MRGRLRVLAAISARTAERKRRVPLVDMVGGLEGSDFGKRRMVGSGLGEWGDVAYHYMYHYSAVGDDDVTGAGEEVVDRVWDDDVVLVDERPR